MSKRTDSIFFFCLALIAGLLIAVNSLSVLAILAASAVFWFILERFECALVIMVFYLPFQVALNVAPGFDLASGRVLILLLFAVWVLRSFKEKKLEIDLSWETLLLCAFLFMSCLSFAQAFEADRAVRKLLVLFSVFPLYFVLTSFAGRKDMLVRILKALYAAGSFIGILGVIQFLMQFVIGIDPLFDFFAKVIAPVFYGNTFAAEVVANPSWLVNIGGVTLLRAFACFSDPHIFSFYLGLIIPILIALALLPASDLARSGLCSDKKWIYAACLFLIMSELFTFSRGGYLGMFFSFGVMALLFWPKLSPRQKHMAWGLSGAAAIILINACSSVVLRFFSSFDLSEGSNMERLKNWREGWNAFADNIFRGVGIGNYSFYLDPTLPYRTPVYAHNLYLDLGAEMGIFALLAWVLLIGVAVRDLYSASRRSSDKLITYLSLGLIGSLVWYSVHSFFDTSIYAPNILAVLMVILSLAVMAVRIVKVER